MTLRPDLVLLPFGDDAVAFSEQAQCMVGLNRSAAGIARALQDGVPAVDLPEYLVQRGLASHQDAGHWASATLAALRSHNMLSDEPQAAAAPAPEDDGWPEVDMPAYMPVTPEVERRYRLLGTCALIRYGREVQAAWTDTVIGHLAVRDETAPTVVIDIEATDIENGELRSDVYRDGVPIACALRISRLAPIVKSMLWQSAVNAHDFQFYVHAGVVGAAASCMLLPAAAGSGKSSLTTALVHRGFRYFSDEVALVQRDFRVPAMPLAMAIKASGWDLIGRLYPRITRGPVHIRGDVKALRYLPPPRAALTQVPMPVSHIVFPHYQPDVTARIERVSHLEAFARMMDQCLVLRQRLDLHSVAELLAWIGGIECFALTHSALEAAVDCVVTATGLAPQS